MISPTTFYAAVTQLFQNGAVRPDRSRCEIYLGPGAWRIIPLEWNQAKNLADILRTQARMTGADGGVQLTYQST